MITRVLGVIRASSWFTSMFHVTESASTTTGLSPALTMAATREMIVNISKILAHQ